MIFFTLVAVTDLICPLGEESGCPNNCECWEIPGNKTIAVDCSYRNLGDSYLPDVTLVKKGLRSYNYTLNLAGNKISFLDPERCLSKANTKMKHFSVPAFSLFKEKTYGSNFFVLQT